MDPVMLAVIRRGVLFDAVREFQKSPASGPSDVSGYHDPDAIEGLAERFFEKFVFMTEELGNAVAVVEQREILLDDLLAHALDSVADVETLVIYRAFDDIKAKYGAHLIRTKDAAYVASGTPRN